MTQYRRWCIQGYDGSDLIYESSVSTHHLYEGKQVEELLKRLVCRHLSEDEIIGASLNGHAKNRTGLLNVSRNDGPPLTLCCGSNPYFIAKIQNFPANFPNTVNSMNGGDQFNRNHQQLIRKTSELSPQYHPRPDHLPKVRIWEMRCGKCGYEYGVNSVDAHHRKCPKCQGGKPGIDRIES